MTILALAPNGAYKDKSNHQELPIADNEIIQTIENNAKLGIIMFHIHIRDESGKHSINAKHYKNILNKLPKNLVLQITSEAAGVFSVKEQIESIKALKPEFVSIALREITRLNSQELKNFFAWLKNNSISPQIIIYDKEDAKKYLKLMQNKELSAKNFPVLIVVGRGENDIRVIDEIVNDIKQYTTSIMFCGFQKLEIDIIDFAIKNNYHLRIGFENNLHNQDGSLANNNQDRISKTLPLINNLENYNKTKQLLTPIWL